MQIKDHVFLVTGASSGIGLSTAVALAERGAKVALLARSKEALGELAARLPGSLPIVADMTDFAGVRQAVQKVHQHYGRIDGLVNNAGRSYAATVEEIEPKLFDEIFHLNVLGPIVAMQAVIPIMRSQGAGSIVNVNSGTAFMTIPPIQRLFILKAGIAGLQPHRAGGTGKRQDCRKRGLSIHYGNQFRKKSDGQSRRSRCELCFRRYARICCRYHSASH